MAMLVYIIGMIACILLACMASFMITFRIKSMTKFIISMMLLSLFSCGVLVYAYHQLMVHYFIEVVVTVEPQVCTEMESKQVHWK